MTTMVLRSSLTIDLAPTKAAFNSHAAASAANASGFLLVSLSKTPRPAVYIFAQKSYAEPFPIKASDQLYTKASHS